MDKVLIVDDSRAAQAVLAAVLGDEFLIELMDDAVSALAAIELNPPDIILLDVNMPVMDGFEACRILKKDEHTREIPIIFITSLDSEDERVKGFEAGADDYVVKPVLPLELLARVRAHLGARKSRHDALVLERMTVFKEMAVTLCHEINNPLTTVNAYLHLLLREDTSEKVKEIVAAVQVEVVRIAAITAKLSAATSAATTRYHRDISMIDLDSCSGGSKC